MRMVESHGTLSIYYKYLCHEALLPDATCSTVDKA